ncbi:MAG: hypothetical protein H7Y17_01340, partial [Chlorobia bacterium]|nr:hypothetical protein [Fimbriimonadaceae bacterium]
TVSGRNAWDDKAALVRKASGRAMVIEIPYDPMTMWTRGWIDGKGWPDGTPISKSARIPGLIPAREAMALLAEPSLWTWIADKKEPSNRWLNFGHEVSPVALVFLAVGAIYVLGLGIYCVLREQYSRVALILIRLLVIGPAALIVGGKLTSLNTLSNWPTWHLGAFVATFLASWLINLIADKWIPDCHPLWGEFALGVFVCAGIDPVWSMFSNVLGPHRAPICPEAFGALASYAVGASYLFSTIRLTRSVWGVLGTCGIVSLVVLSQWLVKLEFAALVLAIVVLARNFANHLRFALPLVVAIGLISALFLPGLAYAPQGLVWSYAQIGKFNCAEQIAFLFSPTFISFALITIVIGIVGDNFLGHQARRAMAFSPKPKSFFYAGVCFAVAGVFIPLYLHASLATVIAGSVVVLFDAIRTP